MKIILDTNVMVSAIQSGNQISRQILRLVLSRQVTPLLSNALFLEYEAITQRSEVMKNCHFSAAEAGQFWYAVFAVSLWVDIYYTWRPNLPDEGDNFLIELAIAGGADCIISKNTKDLKHGELLFPKLKIYQPHEFMQLWSEHR